MSKQMVKLGKPNVKRNKLGEIDERSNRYPPSSFSKKRRTATEFATNAGNVDNEVCFIEYDDDVVNAWCDSADLKTNSCSVHRLKSSGRVVCPTLFNDHVISLLKKENDNESSNKRKNPFFDGELVSKKHNVEQELELDVGFVDVPVSVDNVTFSNNSKKVKTSFKKEKGFIDVPISFGIQDFAVGDIVWAKCSNRFPAWPAVVIDAKREAPASVLKAFVPNTVCVMFYGYSRKGTRVLFRSISLLVCVLFHV